MSKTVYIIEAFRTPIGSPYRSLKNYTAAQLGSAVIKSLLRKTRLKKICVDEVILGNVVGAGVGQNLARQAAALAKLPHATRAYTVNNVCGAGMQSIISGIHSILLDESNVVIAGGAESVSQSPMVVFSADERKLKDANHIDSLFCDGLWCRLTNRHMGELAEDLAKKHRVSRREQDLFAFQSHYKASLAHNDGEFDSQLVSMKTKGEKTYDYDERVRGSIDVQKLAGLSPAFRKGGTVTAGNSSVPCDGAAAVLLASQRSVEQYKLKPLAKIVEYVSVGTNPEEVFASASVAIKECLKKAGRKVQDIDLFEVSEAFAIPPILVQKKLHIPKDKMNVLGGDIALGHPLGVAGTRIVVTLAHALKEQGLKTGIASVCLGGGGALAMLIESVN